MGEKAPHSEGAARGARIARPHAGPAAGGDSPRPTAEPVATLTSLLVTDLVDSTALVDRLGDVRAAEVFARHDSVARFLLATHSGREIDKSDGFLLLFERPIHALAYALDYHAQLRHLAEEEGIPLAARVGIHVGEVFIRENPAADVARGAKPLEVEGLAKLVASRVMSLAQGGQTLLTRAAFDFTRRAAATSETVSDRLVWVAHGLYRFKGVEDALEVFEVGEPGVAPLRPPPGSDKARPVGGEDTVWGWRPAVGQSLPGRPHWRLEQKLGEGGFGEVWLARHRKTREGRVFKFCFGKERLRALQREVTLCRVLRETLGDRRDIARILDWNLDEPPYYLELEYQGGHTLGDWAVRRGGLAAVPTPVRLELAAQIADAVAAAHSVGVLHKDIKPSNILVVEEADGTPRVQVTDFGIGALSEAERVNALGITILGMTESERTGSGTTTGTRLYLAPEVLEGKPVTTQADVYSLGIVIYQLLVGDFSRVLAPGWERDVDDPILAADLSAFLDGRPERRVASAAEVAQRLRSLETRRELARAAAAAAAEAEATRRALEKARRRRRIAVAAAVVVLAFAVAMAALARRIAAERDRANQEAAAAQRVTDFLLNLFQVSDPSEARGNTITARELLDKGAAQLAEELGDQPVLRARLADAIGTVYVQLGLHQEGERLLHQAWELRRQHLGELHADSANSLGDLGFVAEKRGDYAAAEQHYRRALDIYRSLGREHETVVAKVHSSLGWALAEQARWPEAEEQVRTALAIQEKLGSGADDMVAESLTTLAYLHFKQGKYRDAAELLRRVLAIRERLHGPDSLQAAAAKNNLAVQLREIGELDQALAYYRQALAVQERALGPDHPDLGSFFNNIAHIHQDRDELQQAEHFFRRALAVRRAALGEEHPLTASSLSTLCYCLWLGGQLDEAEELCRRALQVRERVLGPDHPDVAFTRSNLGLISLARADYPAARRHFEDALRITQTAFGQDRPAMLPILEGYETLLRHLRETDSAAALAARIAAVRQHAAARGERLPPPVPVRAPL